MIVIMSPLYATSSYQVWKEIWETGTAIGQGDQWHLLQGHDTRDPQGKVVGTLSQCYPSHIRPLHKLSWSERQGEKLGKLMK